MIHAFESEISSDNSRAHRASHSLRAARGTHVSSHRPGISAVDWPVVGFGQPIEPNSLWDTGLLDRLSLPLTRYHE
jgi:hypothetical protein